MRCYNSSVPSRRSLILISLLLFLIVSALQSQASLAQSVSPRTVGDGTAFLFSPGRSESYGIYSGDIGGGDIGSQLYSRPNRMGQSTGIGSSTLQTTSATSQSTPFQVDDQSVRASQTTLSRANISGRFDNTISPALNGYTVSPSSGLNTIRDASPLSSIYAPGGSAAMGASGSTGLFQDLNAVPLFSKRSHSILPMSGAGSETFFKKVDPQF